MSPAMAVFGSVVAVGATVFALILAVRWVLAPYGGGWGA